MSDEQFVLMIQSVKLDEGVLADKLSVSLPAIRRWKAGRNLPHQAIRAAIEKVL